MMMAMMVAGRQAKSMRGLENADQIILFSAAKLNSCHILRNIWNFRSY
jgi:hypothetical protein